MSKTLSEELGEAWDSVVEDEVVQEVVKEEVQTPSEDVSPETHQERSEKESEILSNAEEDSAPAHWSNEDKETFNSVGSDAKKFLLRRHKEMEADFTKKNQARSDDLKVAEAVRKAISEYEPSLRQMGVDPNIAAPQIVQKLLSTDMRLRFGDPAEKADIIRKIVNDYGVTKAEASRMVDDHQQDMEPLDPRINNLMQQVEQQNRYLQSLEYQKQYETKLAAHDTIGSFASEKDESGNAKYPHFEKVRHKMGDVIKAQLTNSLPDAYEQAVLLDKELRDDYIVKRQATMKRALDDNARAENAKKASFNVRSSSGAPAIEEDEPLALGELLARQYDAQMSKR